MGMKGGGGMKKEKKYKWEFTGEYRHPEEGEYFLWDNMPIARWQFIEYNILTNDFRALIMVEVEVKS